MNNPHESRLDGYVTPTPEQLSAQKRRSLAIGGALAAFCALVFALMVVKIKSMGAA